MELLKESLLSIQSRLVNEGKVNYIVARPTLQELKQQRLPSHLKISLKKRIGGRALKRASHHANIPRVIYAGWPEDHLIENTVAGMAFILRGSADMRIADYVISCEPGDCILYPPYVPAADGSQPHFEGDTTGRRCDILMVFPGSLLGQGIECAMCHSIGDEHKNGTHVWIKNLLLAQLFQSLYEESFKPDNAESIFHIIRTLVFFTHREIEEKRSVPPPFKPFYEQPLELGSDAIKQACNYIKTHLASNLTIKEVARLVCISPSTFSQRFRQETGQTFHQYLTALRLKQAAVLLEETDYQINDISTSVGLTDAQLRILTRQHWGCTPKEYRNREK